jgi:hypothetical protein
MPSRAVAPKPVKETGIIWFIADFGFWDFEISSSAGWVIVSEMAFV